VTILKLLQRFIHAIQQPRSERKARSLSDNPLSANSLSVNALSENATAAVLRPKTLKQRILNGSLWTLGGHGVNQVLRLGSNLLLTRLLFPEAFGLMALAQTFLIGLQMFSDVGIFPSIVQSPHGDQPKFLNTAWTLQVIRGAVLSGCAIVLAPLAADFFREPMLKQLLPAIGLTSLIAGFNSTKLATAQRRLNLSALTLLDLASYVAGVIVMILGAWWFKSVWALVVGGWVSSLVLAIASHFYLEGERNRFAWDRASARSLHQFGRWIFLSTLVGFLANQGDRLILGRLMDVHFLGIYTVALGLASAADQIVSQIGNRVLFPSYAELVRERPQDLYRTLRKSRTTLLVVSVSFLLMLVIGGQWIIEFLYDERYLQAGWILRVLAVALVGKTLSSTYGDVLLASGQSFIMMLRVVINTSLQLAAMILGHHWGGYQGMILGIAVAEWLSYVSDSIFYIKLKVWQPEIDLPIIALACGMVGIIWLT
jgi:O-antigen/teichoic acid export membrane protein